MPKTNAKRFTNDEINSIVSDYQNGIILAELGRKYERRPKVILEKLKSLGIYKNKNNRWTNDELRILEENYSSASWDDLMRFLPKHPKADIITKASKIGVRRECYFWTENDIEILKNGYQKKMSSFEIQELLNQKFSIESIVTKAYKLGLVKFGKWTQDETNILINNYPYMNLEEVCKLLPNRDKDNIVAKAAKMGIKSYFYLHRQWNENDDKYLMNNYIDMSDIQLAENLGRTKDAIRGRRAILRLLRPIEKGVYDSLSEYVRKRNKQWKRDSARNCNFQCIITKGRFQAIHHLYGVNLMLQESLSELNIPQKESFDDYNQEELDLIVVKFFEVQDRYPLGICLNEEIHKDFHNKYGYGDNTPEQFEQYLKENNLKIA